MPRRRPGLRANTKLRAARQRLVSPSGSGRPMSRQELAQAVNTWLWDTYDQQENLTYRDVAALERGEVRWPGERRREAFRAILHADKNADIGFYIDRRPRTALVDDIRDLPGSDPGGQMWNVPNEAAIGAEPDSHSLVPLKGRNADRRTAIKLIASASALLAAAGQPGIYLAERSMEGNSRADNRLYAAHIEVAEALAGMYRTVDPRAVLPMAVPYADTLLNLINQGSGVGRPVEFTAVVVGVHAQVGLWACHADQLSVAYRYLATSCELAAAAHDRPLHARTLGALSYLYSSAPRGGADGNPRRALTLLADALALAASADGFTKGWLATWRADQLATLGDRDQAQADVDLAVSSLDDSQTGGYGFFGRVNYGYGMRGHLDSVQALVHALSGETDESERGFSHVHAHAANMRRRVATEAHQALAYAKSGNAEAACAALTRSADLAVGEGYPMGLRRVFGVRAGFEPSWTDLPCVRDIDQHLHHLTAT